MIAQAYKTKILCIDHQDSFTLNIVYYLRMLGAEVKLIQNNQIHLNDPILHQCHAIILSPGPGMPQLTDRTFDVLQRFSETKPILGICLGHQIIAQYFGAHICHAQRIMHGKVSSIEHDGQGIFKGLPSKFSIVRYHSLSVSRSTLPDCLKISSIASDAVDHKEIMSLRHQDLNIESVQFHPEAIQSEYGFQLLQNFITSIPA